MKNKQSRKPRRHVKLTLRLCYGCFLEEAQRLETILAAKPARLYLELVGTGELPADTALLMRSILQARSPQTRVITHARSSLQDGAVLIWLLGDARLIREDARLYLRPAGPFVEDGNAASAWNDRDFNDEDAMEEDDHIRVLQAINEFLPVKELAGQPVEPPVLQQFGLVDNAPLDDFLAAAFGRETPGPEKPRPARKRKRKITKEAN